VTESHLIGGPVSIKSVSQSADRRPKFEHAKFHNIPIEEKKIPNNDSKKYQDAIFTAQQLQLQITTKWNNTHPQALI